MEYFTGAQLVERQLNSIDRITSYNLGYLGIAVGAVLTIGLFILGLVIAAQWFSYKIFDRRIEELENKIKSDTEKDIANIEKKLVKDILGPPRVGELVKINDTIFLVTGDGRIGFTNERALKAFGYEPSSAKYANPNEVALPEMGTISEKKAGFDTPQAQISAELQVESSKEQSNS